MQRRVEEADRHRQPFMASEDADEILALIGNSLASASSRSSRVGEDHLAHRHDAPLVEEHMLGAAEPDALRAEIARCFGVTQLWRGVEAYQNTLYARIHS